LRGGYTCEHSPQRDAVGVTNEPESAADAPRDERAAHDDDAVPARRLRGRNVATHPRRVQSALNKVEVLKLRAAGASWAEIADQLGFKSPKVAYNVCAKALKELPTALNLAEERDLVAYRLDDVYARLADGRLDAQTGGAMIRALTARMGLLGLRVPTEEKVRHTGEIEHTHRAERAMTVEERLAAAEDLQRMIGVVAEKHAQGIIATRDRELAEARETEHANESVAIELSREARPA
jgi:hypothetical protein